MALTLPKLDDRTYADLLEEARALIPSRYPAWTDHNPTDPGITLIELFAWLTEILIYRTDQIPDRHRAIFLKLLNGPDWQLPPGADLDDAVRTTIVGLRQRDRAVTCADYEALARAASPAVRRAKCVPRRYLDAGVEAERAAPRPGHVSVIVVPPRVAFAGIFLFDGAYTDRTQQAATGSGSPFPLLTDVEQLLYIGAQEPFGGILFRLGGQGSGYQLQFEYFNGSKWDLLTRKQQRLTDYTAGWASDGLVRFAAPSDWTPTPVNDTAGYWVRIATTSRPAQVATASQISHALTQTVQNYLEPRRLLTTRHHVVGPFYAPVSAEILIARRADARDDTVRDAVVDAINRMLDPLPAEPDRAGWPFGRDVYVSELYELLEGVAGVDYIPDITLASVCDSEVERCVPAAELWHDDGDQIGLGLHAHHLPWPRIEPGRVIVAASFVRVQVAIQATAAGTAAPQEARGAVKLAVRRLFHPLYGGPRWARWRTEDRDVTSGAIRTAVRNLPEIDRGVPVVVQLSADPAALLRDNQGNVAGVRVRRQVLADVQVEVALE